MAKADNTQINKESYNIQRKPRNDIRRIAH
jgi:hypothetical protein